MRSLPVSVVSAAVGAFVLRGVVALPFLTDGRLRLDDLDDGSLPMKAEVFFSLLILTLVVGPAGAYLWVSRRHSDQDPWILGAMVATALVAVFTILDIALNLAVSGRSLSEFFTNQLLDYSPLVLVPLAMGLAGRNMMRQRQA